MSTSRLMSAAHETKKKRQDLRRGSGRRRERERGRSGTRGDALEGTIKKKR